MNRHEILGWPSVRSAALLGAIVAIVAVSAPGARGAIRQLKRQFGGQLPCSVRVSLRGGRHPLAEPFVLGPEDSGTADFPRFCRNIICNAANAAYVALKRPQRGLAQSDYNLLFDVGDATSYLETRREQGYEVHSRIADPMFVDPAKDDYRLKPGSPALKLGFQPIDLGQIGPRTSR